MIMVYHDYGDNGLAIIGIIWFLMIARNGIVIDLKGIMIPQL